MIKKKEIQSLLLILKKTIGDEYRATEEDIRPSILVTFGCNDDMTAWNYQTGDTSFMGNVYGLPHWAAVNLYRNSSTIALSKEVFDQWKMLIPLEEDNDNNCR